MCQELPDAYFRKSDREEHLAGTAGRPESFQIFYVIFSSHGFSVPFRMQIDIYIYLGILAKASFSAYVLVKCLLNARTGEKSALHFSTKKSTTNFGLPFCFFPFPFFLKMAKICVYIYIYARHKYLCRQHFMYHDTAPRVGNSN